MGSKTARSSQNGSTVSFVIVGVVLIALVAGGVYLLQHRNSSTSPVATKSTTPSVSPTTTANPPAPAPTSATAPPPSKAPQAPTTTKGTTTAPLPSTGPSDLLPGGIVTAIITGSSVAYIQSTRARRQLRTQ